MSDDWTPKPLGRALRHRSEFILIDDLLTYKRCRVQLHAQGIVLRDIVCGAEIKTKKQQECQVGEFLVAEIDAKLGGFGIVPDGLAGAIVSSHYFLFQIDESVVLRPFLDYFIRTPGFLEQVAARGSTNYAAIRPRQVLGYFMPMPALDTQRLVIRHLSKLDEAKRLHDEAGRELAALTNAMLSAAFRGEL